ncbi:MAG: S8 family serine peptidase [Verrucomicrobia bacterium]|nr:S8 family serine peptidase [Verrucomicrobiota bacterium]
MNRLWFWLSLAGAGGFGWGTLAADLPEPATVRFQFREPQATTYRVKAPTAASTALATATTDWIKAWPERGAKTPVELSSRVVLQLASPSELPRFLYGRPLKLARAVAENTFILQAPDTWTALQQAQSLAGLPTVLTSYPVKRRRIGLHGPYAHRPNDPYFPRQWHLENRNTDGTPAGPDLNVRAAWPFTRGEGITVALGDDGVELSHADLAKRVEGAPHHNFVTDRSDGLPVADSQLHGTAVAGIVAATGDNQRGVAGVAPRAHLASWVIFGTGDSIVNEERLGDMFQFASNVVNVQNHSWGNADSPQLGATLLERIGLTNALTKGRGGKGVVIVRSGGNNRGNGGDTNDDEYAADPRAIAVAAVRTDGRAASYSNVGACLLVAAPSGDKQEHFLGIATTDRLGGLGENPVPSLDDAADYAFGDFAFSGTSAAAPQISGLAALLLSANPALTSRDVQQILLLSARHFDLADPDLVANGAGLLVSHNAGFGVPDAGVAVRLARTWSNRPPLTNIILTATNQVAIPDDALRLIVTGADVPAQLRSIRTLPSGGPHADTPTDEVPLVHLGQVTNVISTDLHGKAALIQRGVAFFRDKIEWAAQAGAAFTIIYNNVEGDKLVVMGLTDFVPIPAVFIGQTDGEALRDFVEQNPGTPAQIRLDAATYTFEVADTLLCEHVGVKITTAGTRRGDLRITLLSPQGTRSVLQHANPDDTLGPDGWTYYSTHHFYESSAGTWTVALADEEANNAGSATEVCLILRGVPIPDSDHDGLDDDWEAANFGSLAQVPSADPDGDGASNVREQILGTNPLLDETVFQADVSPFDETRVRLSWPGRADVLYEILAAPDATAPFTLLTNVVGRSGEMEWFVPAPNSSQSFFRVRAVSAP